MNSITSWKTLWNNIRDSDCTLCSLSEDAETPCLCGRGPVPADLMLVGEAPGYHEDDEGRPFTGRAGRLLDQYLKEAGLDREDIYISNVVKCRPAGDRTPTKDEMRACAGYLQKEIEIVKPKYIVLLGNSALWGVLGKSGVKKYRGQWFQVGETQVLATYHPAAVLRNPRFGAILKSDFTRVALTMAGKQREDDNITFLYIRTKTDLREALMACKDARCIAYDIETKDNLVLCMSLYLRSSRGEYKGYFIPLGHPQSHLRKGWEKVMRLFVPVIERRPPYRAITIAQNGKFDNKHFIRLFGCRPHLSFDTMLASHLIDENMPHGLDYLSQTFCDAPAYKGKVDRKNLHKEELKVVAYYNVQDSYYTLKLYEILGRMLRRDPRLWNIFKYGVMPGARAFEMAESRGMWIDAERLEEQTQIVLAKVDEILAEMQEYLPEDVTINYNSPKQVAWVLFEHLELDIVDFTKTGNPSTAEASLVYMDHPFVDLLLEYRKWSKLYSTYLRPWKEKADEDFRIHTNFKLHGTVTGRLSSSNPNLQNVPREGDIRSLFGAPPGWVFVEADYSQIELRIVAHTAHERAMMQVYQTGGDIHTETAAQVSGKPVEAVTPEDRKRAKAVNFGFVYGMSANKFKHYAKEKYGVEFTDSEARQVRKNYFNKYKGLRPWYERQRRIVERLGYVRSVLGRKRRLPDIHSTEEGVQAEALRQSINSPIQAVPPDLTLLAIGILAKKQGFWKDIHMVGQVHDALLFEVREGHLEKWLGIIKETMENPPIRKLFDVELLVPIEVEVKYGKSWGKGTLWEGGDK